MAINGPAVVLTRAQHVLITNRIRRILPYGTDLIGKGKNNILEYYRQIYDGFPELLKVVEDHFKLIP